MVWAMRPVQGVLQGIDRLTAALEAAPKSVRWRVRARVGTRVRWYDEVEEQGV